MGSGTFKIAAGSVATIAGIALAPPTGGLTAFIAGLGAILWADGFREDAVLDNEHRSASSEREELLRRLRELEKTLD